MKTRELASKDLDTKHGEGTFAFTKEQAQKHLDEKYGPGVYVCVERALDDGQVRCEIHPGPKLRRPE